MKRLWYTPTVVCPGLMILGALGAWSGVLPAGTGFFLFFLGTGLAILTGIGLAGTAALGTALNKSWRPEAVRAAFVPLVIAIVAFVYQGATNYPRINDISTDLVERPSFTPDVAASPQVAPDHGPEVLTLFAEAQKEAYPDIASIRLDTASDAAYERALRTARAMPSWEVVVSDPARGRIEAFATSRIFRFRDDISIRIRADGSGSHIDVRSRSRLGIGDMGANAKRIRAFAAALASS